MAMFNSYVIIIIHSPELLGHFGMISRILTMIPVRENSEVVIIYPDVYT